MTQSEEAVETLNISPFWTARDGLLLHSLH